MLDELAARWSDGPGGPLLDVGCGTGRVAAHLAASGVDVLGADLSPGMVAAARRAHPGLPFLVAAADALPLPDACAGGVLAWYSVIHTAPAGLAAVVAELRRVARPGAPLLAAFQAGHGERDEVAGAYGTDVTLAVHRHDPGRLAALLVAGGFDVRARVERAAEGRERRPQAALLATAR
ncbi:class I SAM-dependent methyltransferase [Cellulomonas hominis]|uniref:class I SAM-dependent methyltransferase n=1 Tax=Cellulomonas hominis TaxID=156981 RepID=UPI00353168FB